MLFYTDAAPAQHPLCLLGLVLMASAILSPSAGAQTSTDQPSGLVDRDLMLPRLREADLGAETMNVAASQTADTAGPPGIGFELQRTAMHGTGQEKTPVPPWCVGPVPIAGEGWGWSATFLHEHARFDVTDNAAFPTVALGGAVEWDVDMLSLGAIVDGWALGLRLGAPKIQDSDVGDTNGGVIGGMRVGRHLAQFDRFALGLDTSFDIGDSSLSPNSDVRWVQSDTRLGLAFSPSPDVLTSVAPFAGLGLRVLDGVQRDAGGLFYEVDAVLPYGFAGAAFNWRPKDDLQVGMEAQVMLGAMQGFLITFIVSF